LGAQKFNSFTQLIDHFKSEETCQEYLVKQCWNGLSCKFNDFFGMLSICIFELSFDFLPSGKFIVRGVDKIECIGK